MDHPNPHQRPAAPEDRPRLLPSLVHLETNRQNPLQQAGKGLEALAGPAESFRHSGWARTRNLVYHALRTSGQSVTRILAFASCGAFAHVMQSIDDPERFKLAGSSCRDRFCYPCAKARSQTIANNLRNAIANKRTRFITLTLKSSDKPLAEQLDHLYGAFRALRRTKLWKSKVLGGAAFLETTFNEKSERFHPHLHIIAVGAYLPQRNLSDAWCRASQGSRIVDIRAIRDQDAIARYVCKYCAKPLDPGSLHRPGVLRQTIEAYKGRRLCLTFGTLRGVKLTEPKTDGAWIDCGNFNDLYDAAHRGETRALEVLARVCGPEWIEAHGLADRASRPPPPPPTNAQRCLDLQPNLDHLWR